MNAFIINATVSFLASLVLHELGHYIAARMCAVPVRRAGLGWGPKLFGMRVGEVDCEARLLPVGAYVQMDMKALQTKPLVQQLFVLGAGIGVNVQQGLEIVQPERAEHQARRPDRPGRCERQLHPTILAHRPARRHLSVGR